MLSSFLLELSIFLDHALFLMEHGFIMETSCHSKTSLVNLSQSVSLLLLLILLLRFSDLSRCTKHSALQHPSAICRHVCWFVQKKKNIL